MHTTTDLLDLIEQAHRRQRAMLVGVAAAFGVLLILILILHGADRRLARVGVASSFRGFDREVAAVDGDRNVDGDMKAVSFESNPDTGCLMIAGGCDAPLVEEDMLPRVPVGVVADNDGLVYESDFSDGLADDWQALSGSWKVQDGALNEVLDCGYDYTAVLMTKPVANFRLETTFHSTSGPNQGGVVIHQSSPDTRSGATLVDLAEGGTVLRWGTYDSEGYYVYTGSLVIQPVAPGESVTLTLEVHGRDTQVLLNGLFVARFHNGYTSGLVGLVSTKSAVAFETVRLVNVPGGALKHRNAIDGGK